MSKHYSWFLNACNKVISVNSTLRTRYISCNNNTQGVNLTELGNLTMVDKPNLKPPDHVGGITKLDKNLFEKTITVPCLVANNIKISSVLPTLKKYLLKLENFKPIENLETGQTVIYLNPEKVQRWDDLESEDRDNLTRLSLNEKSIESRLHTLKYENYSAETILKSVLPKDVEGTSSFTKVGHIVHVNLREHLHPYKDVIGQVLFEKVPGCRTVVNKIDMIDNTYRNFKMEILHGEECFLTQVKENRCIFEFDFSKVYWNSRLCTEHERIVNLVKNNEVFFDVFAGVGPFSIPIAKKKGCVFANDLNPESFKWLEHNAKINKIDSKYFKSYNKDGKDFILEEIRDKLPEFLNDKRKIYICMNLPALAVDFLRYFINLYKEEELNDFEQPPIVIVYCFTKGEDCKTLAKNLILQKIGCDISDKIIDIFRVRTVSSLKEMMRITFRLDKDILTGCVSGKNKRKLDLSDTSAKKCNYGEKTEKDE